MLLSNVMEKPVNHNLIVTASFITGMAGLILMVTTLLISGLFVRLPEAETDSAISENFSQDAGRWSAPEIKSIPKNQRGELILYGRELILHSEKYFGPKGSIHLSGNGMSCTNCHLNGGTKYFGNNFSAVAATYPKFRPRYGAIESIEMRINDCIVRSLQGQRLDTASREMKAFVSYIQWVGKDVEKGISPEGVGLKPIAFLERAASPENGRVVYQQKCFMCHGLSGEGMLKSDSSSWLNPPVWGNQSYTIGAGMYRIGRLAFFIKANMPWGINSDAPQLTDEQAWDVAAYINSMPRPAMNLFRDWPDISKKPFDYPFGPYVDSFSEEHHKYGPYTAMAEMQPEIVQKTREIKSSNKTRTP